jgi:16S rRNA C967 or C1407 C5-methylase (RsmB/RsmF family)/NOL1/NOP2/fmu family ribosome biogenesis protein
MTKIALPKDFVSRVQNDAFLGQDLLDALETEQPIAIRFNSSKNKQLFTDTTTIPWSKNGVYLTERPSFTLDPLFHAGCYYPQEAGSQFLDAILRQIELPLHPIVLDLCAAPGGKSTLIADYLNGRGLLVANEVIQNRSKILKENLVKWGATNTLVSNNDPAQFGGLTSVFDCIVVDAPCSGEGMFRKDHQARNEWSENNVDLCVGRQRRIVMDVWDSLKEDGFLIYSTCTFNRQENEDNVQWLLTETGGEIVPLTINHAKSDREKLGYYCLPHLIDTEGFYFAVIQKKNGKKPKKMKPAKSLVTPLKDNSFLTPFVTSQQVSFVQWSDFAFAIPSGFIELIQLFHSELRLIKMGTECGEISRKGLIPNESLALNAEILNQTIPVHELTKHDALRYLHGDTFPLNGPVGFGIVSYEGIPLGWIKNLGNRFNNLYPKEWRIRMRID